MSSNQYNFLSNKGFSRKCVLGLGMGLCLFSQQMFADKLDLTTHGRLSAGYFGNSGQFGHKGMAPGLLGLNAYVMANFGLNENWDIGMGAAGMWNVFSMFPFQDEVYSNGDVADIYLSYKKGGLKIAAGRYNVDTGKTVIRSTDFINGHLQGVSVQWVPRDSSPFRMWLSYINSFFDNGYLPGRIGSNLAYVNPYFSAGKIKLGGEVVVFGADYKTNIGKTGHKIFFSPWALLNTKAPAPNPNTSMKFDLLAQVGVKGSFVYNINPAWKSITKGNLVFQYGNGIDSNASIDDLVGFVDIDEEIKYTRYRTHNDKQYVDFSVSMGAGFRGVIANKSGTFFTINDRNRFYGRFLNGANYNMGNAMTFYLFGKIDHRIFEAHVLLGGGTYSEVSVIGSWKAYRQKRYSDEGSVLGFDIGGGYSFATSSAGVGGVAGNHGLMVFGKLSY